MQQLEDRRVPAVVGGEVFLQGNYVEVGIHSAGSFGTANSAPTGFHPKGPSQLGFVVDPGKDGWTTGTPAQSGDFFLPGAPEEGWSLEWTSPTGGEKAFHNYGRMSPHQVAQQSLTETSSGDTQSAVWVGTATSGGEQLRVTQTVRFNKNDQFFVMNVVLANIGTSTVNSVEYMRNVDPDQEQALGYSFTTDNYVVYQPSGTATGEQRALVVGKGIGYGIPLGLGTIDSRARVSTEGLTNRDPDAIYDSPNAPSPSSPRRADEAIALAYRLGSLAPGQSVSLDYAYILNQSDLENALGQLAAVTILQPTGTVSGNDVIFQATTDNVPNTTKIDFYVNGTRVGTDTTPTTLGVYEARFDSTAFANGTLNLKSVATFVGGRTVEKTTTVTVDNAGPPIALSAPTPGQPFQGSDIPIAVTALDPAHPPTRVSFFRESASGGSVFLGEDTAAPFTSSFSVLGLPEGEVAVIKAVARDALGRTTTAQVSGTVFRNTAPVANGQTVAVTEDTARSITLTGSDADGDPLIYSVVGGPLLGTLSGTAPNLVYTPAPNYFGSDSFTFNVNDGKSVSAVATVTINVSAVNDAPVLTDVRDATINEEQLYRFTAGAVDVDTPRANLGFSLSGAPAGAAIDATTGGFSWTPSELQGPGEYRFFVDVTDGNLTARQPITLTVREVNRAPGIDPIADQTVKEGSRLELTVTASDPDLPPNNLTYSLVGAPAGASIRPTTGVFSWTPSDGLGSHLVTVQVTDDGNPLLSGQTSFRIAVTNVAPTATLASGGPVTYGAATTVNFSDQFDPSSADTVAGFAYAYSLDGTNFTAGGSSAQFSLNAGTHIVHGRIYDRDGDYTQYATEVTVNKATPTVTVAPVSATYDKTAHGTTGVVTGVGGAVIGTAAISYRSGSAPVDAGSYTATGSFAGDANYLPATGTAVIDIVKAHVAVSATGGTFTYDGLAHAATGSVTGVGGEDLGALTFLYNGGGAAPVDAGTYAVVASFAGGANYHAGFGTATVVIAKAEQVITWATPAAITYGTALGAAQLNAAVAGVAGGSAAGALSYSHAAGTLLIAGDHTLTVTAAETANYKSASVSVALPVDKATLTVAVDHRSRTYGDANPTLTGNLTGVVGGDNITVGYGTAATATSPVGSYAITATLADPDNRLSNYTVSNPGGTLTVIKATLTMDVDAVSRTYGAANPAFTGTVTGRKNGESFTADYSTAATAASPVGSYDVAAALGGATLPNYDVVINGAGKLTVTPAALTVTPADVSRVYGADTPTLTGSIVGVQNGDAITSAYSTAATAASPVGVYAITATLADPHGKHGNYTVTLNTGRLEVTKATAAVVVHGYTGTYDGQAHGLAGSVTGARGEDLTGRLDLGAPQTNAGSYTVAWSFAGDVNHGPASGTAAIQLAKADATISVTGYTGVFDGGAHGASGTAMGVTGEGLSGLDLGASFVNAPGGTANWAFTDQTGNYNDARGSVDIVIARADPPSSVAAVSPVTYDGQSHGTSGSVVGVGGAVLSSAVVYTDDQGNVVPAPVRAGTYAATVSFAGDGNYNPASASTTIVINKAISVTTVTGESLTYDGLAHGGTGVSVSGAGTVTGAATRSYSGTRADGTAYGPTATAPVDAGTYTVTATYAGDANHNGSTASATITIARATPTVTVVGGSFVYDGLGHPATGSITGVGGEDLGTPTFTYSCTDDHGNVVTTTAPPVESGYYTVTASFAGNGNCTPASATATITIAYEARTLTDLSKAFKAGRTIPIKLQLTDANGNNVSSAGTAVTALRLERVDANGTRTQVALRDAGNANPSDLFRYDTQLGGYIFNLSTMGLTAGTYESFWMAEGDPTENRFGLRLV